MESFIIHTHSISTAASRIGWLDNHDSRNILRQVLPSRRYHTLPLTPLASSKLTIISRPQSRRPIPRRLHHRLGLQHQTSPHRLRRPPRVHHPAAGLLQPISHHQHTRRQVLRPRLPRRHPAHQVPAQRVHLQLWPRPRCGCRPDSV